MKDYNPGKPLYSIHIPKSGGTSIFEVLKLWFGRRLYIHYFNEEKKMMPIKHKLEAGCCVHGHFNKKRRFGVHDYYPEADQFITILRDPFDILVSRYFFEKKQAKVNGSFRDGRKLNLEETIDDYLNREITNEDYHPNILDYLPGEVNFGNYREMLSQNFIFIGIMEEMQNSVDAMARKLNKPFVDIQILNQSDYDQNYDENLRLRFRDNHTLEYAVYQFARENFKIKI